MKRVKDGEKFLLTDWWYGKKFPHIAICLDEIIPAFLLPIVSKISFLRALILVVLGRNLPIIVTVWAQAGRPLCVFQALFGGRKIVYLEFIDFNDKKKSPLLAKIYDFCAEYVLGPCLRRSMLGCQVLTEWERELAIKRYGLDENQVKCIPWPLNMKEVPARSFEETPREEMVFSSGRAACDWETLFAAAEIGGWPLTVVCAEKDYARVSRLNKSGKVRVLHEIPREEHDRLFSLATVYVLCLRDEVKSSGHIRLASGIQAGVPVVASRVRGLDGYLIDGTTAISVPEGNAQILADTVSRLLSNPEERIELAKKALEYSKTSTGQHYIDSIVSYLEEKRMSV